MAIPENIQGRINAYLVNLINRFPPSVDYYKLSVGYSKPGDAVNDITPARVIFTQNDLQPILDSLLYTDSAKTARLDGRNLWYHVFDKTSADLKYIIQVTRNGVVAEVYVY